MLFPCFVQHLAIILELRDVGMLVVSFCGDFFIDVAKCDDIFRLGAPSYVTAGLSARTDRCDVQLLVGRFVAQRLERWLAAKSDEWNSSRQYAAKEKYLLEMPSDFMIPAPFGS